MGNQISSKKRKQQKAEDQKRTSIKGKSKKERAPRVIGSQQRNLTETVSFSDGIERKVQEKIHFIHNYIKTDTPHSLLHEEDDSRSPTYEMDRNAEGDDHTDTKASTSDIPSGISQSSALINLSDPTGLDDDYSHLYYEDNHDSKEIEAIDEKRSQNKAILNFFQDIVNPTKEKEIEILDNKISRLVNLLSNLFKVHMNFLRELNYSFFPSFEKIYQNTMDMLQTFISTEHSQKEQSIIDLINLIQNFNDEKFTFTEFQSFLDQKKLGDVVETSPENKILNEKKDAIPKTDRLLINQQDQKLIRSESYQVLEKAGLSHSSIITLLKSKPEREDSKSEYFEDDLQMQIDCLQECLKVGEQYAKEAVNKECIILFGRTGVGKSTTINYLLGCEFKRELQVFKEIIQVSPDSKIPETAKIGHSTDSLTIMPQLYSQDDMVLCDCPGLWDNRSRLAKIVNAINIKKIIDKSSRFVILLLCEYSDLHSGKSDQFKSLIEIVRQFFSKEINQHISSIILGITKIKNDPVGITMEAIREGVSEIAPEIPWKLENIISFDPLERDIIPDISKRNAIIEKLKNLQPIQSSDLGSLLTEDEINYSAALSLKVNSNIRLNLRDGKLQQAARLLTCANQLQMISHSEARKNYEEICNLVSDRFSMLFEAFKNTCSEYQFEQAFENLLTLKRYEALFQPMIVFSKYIEEAETLLRNKKFSFYRNELYKSRQELLSIIYSNKNQEIYFYIYFLIKKDSITHYAQNPINYFLCLSDGHISPIVDQYIYNLMNLKNYANYTPELNLEYKNERNKMGSALKDLFDKISKEIEDKLDKILLELEISIKKYINSLIQKITWQEFGEEMLALLKKIIDDKDDKNVYFIESLKYYEQLTSDIDMIINILVKVSQITAFMNRSEELLIKIQRICLAGLQQCMDNLKASKRVLVAKNASIQAEEALNQNKFGIVSKKIEVILKNDPRQIIAISLAKKIDQLKDSYINLFDQGNYSSSWFHLKLLIRLNEYLSKYFDRFNIQLNINKSIESILNKVKPMLDDLRKPIKKSLEQEILSQDNFFDEELFSKIKKTMTVLNELSDMKEISEMGANFLQECFQLINSKLIEANFFFVKNTVHLLIQTRALGIGFGDLSFIKFVENRMNELLNKRKELVPGSPLLPSDAPDGETFILNMGKQLEALLTHSDVGRFASEVIEKYPQFITLRREKMHKLTSKEGGTVLDELKVPINFPIRESYRAYCDYFSEYDDKIYKLLQDDAFKSSDNKSNTNFESKTKETPSTLEIKIIESAKKYALILSKANKKFYKYPKEVGSLIASIFAMWCFLDAKNLNRLASKSALLKPYSTQIISLMSFLGMNTQKEMQNHLIEMKTGEGKSIATAGFAIMMALMGYYVDIACYHPYLASRDEHAFRELFKAFGLMYQIRYFELGNLIDARIGEIANTRKLAKFLLENDLKSVDQKSNEPKKRILFIDEVDVFFSEHFMGKTYNPVNIVKDEDFQNLLKDLWNNYQNEPSENQILHNSHFKKFLVKYPNTYIIQKDVMNEIWQALEAVKSGSHTVEYKILNGNIAYKDKASGTLSTSTYYGYETIFLYLKHYETGEISEAVLRDNIGFMLHSGNFSYTELPKLKPVGFYDVIMGITGTLRSLSSAESELLDTYEFKERSYMPSIYKRQTLQETPISVFGGEIDADDKQGYFLNIKMEIEEIISHDRAILVVFETEERLQKFQHYLNLHPYNFHDPKIQIISSETGKVYIEQRIAEASNVGQITLLTKEFARGSDFVCHNSQLRKNGGVHVCQTFYAESASEEIQIRGRTCRQTDPGSYHMILYLGDLQSNFNVKNIDEKEQYEKENDISQQPWVEFLQEKRRVKFEKRVKILNNSIEQSKEKHEQTMRFAALMQTRGFFASFSSQSRKEEALAILKGWQK